jgi:hypothetical protein
VPSNVLDRDRLSIAELALENKTKKLSRKCYGLNRVGEFETLFCAIIIEGVVNSCRKDGKKLEINGMVNTFSQLDQIENMLYIQEVTCALMDPKRVAYDSRTQNPPQPNA